MIQEALDLKESASKLSFQTTNIASVARAENEFPGPNVEYGSSAFDTRKRTNQPHDMLKFGGGASFFFTILWWIIGTSSLTFERET